MDRKKFIASVLPLGIAVSGMLPRKGLLALEPDAPVKIPPYLKKGDCIGICCVAGYITLEDVQPAINKIREWGFEVKVGNTVGKKDFTYGGTDKERLNDFQQMLDDKNIKAILCARGGYGSIRIIDKINFSQFVLHPKWIIGFSDVTVLHCHINRNFGIASLHSKMCNSFPDNWKDAEAVQKDSIESIRQCLDGATMNYSCAFNPKNKTGIAEGNLIGGNLETIQSLAGSVSDIHTDGKILFVEDTDEYLYSIDRLFWSLKRSGKLSALKGLIIGGFKTKKDDPGDEFGKTIEEIVLEKVSEYNYPVCFDFPVGHQKNNVALKCGVRHRLIVNEKSTTLSVL